jgi:protein-ribulosamine 3-kinase
MDETLLGKIQAVIKRRPINFIPVFGGCISSAYKLSFEDGEELFCKISKHKTPMFFCENEGLLELKKDKVRVPSVIHTDDQFILMEYIQNGRADKDTFYNLGKNIAELHKIKMKYFGFKEDNFIGSNPQKNPFSSSWVDFFFENRLKFQYKLAESKKLLNLEIKQGFKLLEKKIHKIIENEGEPSLIHGDLWSGNILVDKSSKAVLIDPAVYYGNREAEFGILTLFGGSIGVEFFRGYNESYLLSDGWEERNKIYQLYHLLNHLNLFGKGYWPQIIEILNYFN